MLITYCVAMGRVLLSNASVFTKNLFCSSDTFLVVVLLSTAEGSRTVVEVTRGCVPFTQSEGCISGDHLGISADICTCNTELCNNAKTIVPPTGLLIMLGMLTFRIL